MIPRSDITGVVLAGGQGTRMGGVDKGLQPLGGRPLVAHALERLAPQVGGLMVNANRHLDLYAGWGWPVVTDAAAEATAGTGTGAGPLAGVLAALDACGTPWLATVPCDSPWFPLDLVARMARRLSADADADADTNANADAGLDARQAPPLCAYAVTPGDTLHGHHPVFCMLHRGSRDSLERHLRAGGRAMRGWLAQSGALEIVFDEPAAFRNINTAQQLRDAAAPPQP